MVPGGQKGFELLPAHDSAASLRGQVSRAVKGTRFTLRSVLIPGLESDLPLLFCLAIKTGLGGPQIPIHVHHPCFMTLELGHNINTVYPFPGCKNELQK